MTKRYYSLRDLFNTMNPPTLFEDIDERACRCCSGCCRRSWRRRRSSRWSRSAGAADPRLFDRELKEVIDELYVDDAVDIVEEMPANVVQRILTQADPEMRKQINEILRYPENSAGSIMTTEYVSLRPNMTVEEAILRIRRTGIDKETIYTCYVTRGHKLIGLVSVKDLLLCEDDEATIESIMQDHVITVNTSDDQEQVAQMFSKYNFLALPVVDTETASSASSPSTTPWTSWRTRRPRTWKRWLLCCRPSIRTCGRPRLRSGRTVSRGCCF